MPSDFFAHRNPSPSSTAEEGPLSGKSIAIQSNISHQGWPTEAGSIALQGYTPLDDATVVDRLQRAGALLIGSTCMSELGFGLAGDRGAKAVTEGHVDVLIMIDAMGESRIVASMSNLWGFKPTYGMVSRYGLIGLVPSMECCGIVAKRPEDVTLAMRVIAGLDQQDYSMPDEADSGFPMDGERWNSIRTVGVVKQCLERLSVDEVEMFRSGLSSLQERGYRIQTVEMADFNLFPVVHQVAGSVEASSSAGKYDGVRYGHRAASATNWNEMYLQSRAESFGPLIKSYLFQGAYFQFEDYGAFRDACRIRARLVKGMKDLLSQVDILAFPTRRKGHPAETAETVSQVYDAFMLTLAANVTGLPSLQIPGIVRNGDLDLGLQLVGPRLSDPGLLSIGHRMLC